MRTYDTEIDDLYKRIEALELEKNTSKRQRNKIPAVKRKEKERNDQS